MLLPVLAVRSRPRPRAVSRRGRGYDRFRYGAELSRVGTVDAVASGIGRDPEFDATVDLLFHPRSFFPAPLVRRHGELSITWPHLSCSWLCWQRGTGYWVRQPDVEAAALVAAVTTAALLSHGLPAVPDGALCARIVLGRPPLGQHQGPNRAGSSRSRVTSDGSPPSICITPSTTKD